MTSNTPDPLNRMNNRRDSPRLPMSFLVREAGEENPWEEREGNLSIGGIDWLGESPLKGQKVDVRFRLPGVPSEIHAQGEIIRLSDSAEGIGFHVRFIELDVQSELALARYIDGQVARAT